MNTMVHMAYTVLLSPVSILSPYSIYNILIYLRIRREEREREKKEREETAAPGLRSLCPPGGAVPAPAYHKPRAVRTPPEPLPATTPPQDRHGGGAYHIPRDAQRVPSHPARATPHALPSLHLQHAGRTARQDPRRPRPAQSQAPRVS